MDDCPTGLGPLPVNVLDEATALSDSSAMGATFPEDAEGGRKRTIGTTV